MLSPNVPAPIIPVSGVLRELLALLCCPECARTGNEARLSGWQGDTPTGTLVCDSCARVYPVTENIPCLLPDALRDVVTLPPPNNSTETGEKRREMAARDAQADDYDRMLGLKLFTNAEVPLSLRYLWPEPDHLLLEGGCGTGRMTGAFADAVRGVLALDFSHTSILAAQAKLSPVQRTKVLFVQADLTQAPVRSNMLDRVGSFGVYEHIPTPSARDRALAEMARIVKSREAGGRWAMSAYRWGLPQSLWCEREGHHAGGIYFRRFALPELVGLCQAHFDVGGATETLLYYHLVWGRKRGA